MQMSANQVHKIVLALVFMGIAVPRWASGQTKIDSHLPDGSSRMLGLLPESSKVLFPGSRVLLEKKDVKVNLSAANQALLREIQFVAASDYPLERTSGAQSKDRRRSIKITAVMYGDTLFVVNDLFFGDNSAVISKLLQSLEVHTDNEEKALQVAIFYLQLARYRFEEPAHYVVSSSLQLPPEQVNFPGQNITEIENAIHSPNVKKDGDAYKVDVLTQDVDAAFVLLRHWTITILDSQIANVQEEVVIPGRMHYRTGETPTDRFGGTLASPVTDLRFQLSIMADGMTADSKHLNVSTYVFNTSNGPQVRRSVSSFDSAERAVREFREQLNRAGQILEQGNWLGKGGETIGERALVVYSTEKTNDLSAVILLRRDSRLFEVSSSCLRNLLEFEKVWFRN